MPQINKKQASGAIFLIGWGILFITGYWFPGILRVLAATALAGSLVDGDPKKARASAMWLIVMGLAFSLPPVLSELLGTHVGWLPVLLILMGLLMLFSPESRPSMPGKSKNDEEDGDIITF